MTSKKRLRRRIRDLQAVNDFKDAEYRRLVDAAVTQALSVARIYRAIAKELQREIPVDDPPLCGACGGYNPRDEGCCDGTCACHHGQ